MHHILSLSLSLFLSPLSLFYILHRLPRQSQGQINMKIFCSIQLMRRAYDQYSSDRRQGEGLTGLTGGDLFPCGNADRGH
ncbi:hypothetical protein V8C37DRAFT_365084 [Trichoderma ceciliae]